MKLDTTQPGAVPTALLQRLKTGDCLTTDQLEIEFSEKGVNRDQITKAALCLLRRDFVMIMGSGCYQLTEAGIAAAEEGKRVIGQFRESHPAPVVRQNTFRTRVWGSMRRRQQFTYGDLVMDVARPSDKSPKKMIRVYVSELQSGGYVAELPKRITRGGQRPCKLFVLMKDTGPKHPVYLRKKQAIFDQNTKERVKCSRA